MTKTANGHSVFLSYASSDRRYVKEIVKNLKARGLLTENDEIIDSAKVFVPGSSLRDTLREAIQSAGKVIVVWSDRGAGSQSVNYEMGMAEALGKPIIIVAPGGNAPLLPSEFRQAPVVEIGQDV